MFWHDHTIQTFALNIHHRLSIAIYWVTNSAGAVEYRSSVALWRAKPNGGWGIMHDTVQEFSAVGEFATDAAWQQAYQYAKGFIKLLCIGKYPQPIPVDGMSDRKAHLTRALNLYNNRKHREAWQKFWDENLISVHVEGGEEDYKRYLAVVQN
jgi:hypothetical protein